VLGLRASGSCVLSAKSFAAVQRAFPIEAENAFHFLVAEFGYAGPEGTQLVIQELSYVRPGLRCRISFDQSEMSVMVMVERQAGDARLVAPLDALAAAAGIVSANKVPQTVHTAKRLGGVLHEQACLLRLLQPFLDDAHAADLMDRAGARRWIIH
jgi:hypothetical protein